MIRSKKDLDYFLSVDNNLLLGKNRKIHLSYMKKTKDPRYKIAMYINYLRKEEYYLNSAQNILKKALTLFYERKRNKLGERLGFCMETNSFDSGLNIFHTGCIVVNPNASIGKNCSLHGNNCIGNNGKDDKCPKIGNNVDIGFGAVLIGDIAIADNIKIGANAVVNKSFFEEGVTIAGVPAKVVKK